MKPSIRRAHVLKGLLLVLWGALLMATYTALDAKGIRIRDLPFLLKTTAEHAGPWGPFLLIITYVTTAVIPFPTSALGVLTGALYGPWLGMLVVVAGLNAVSAVSFFLGRFFGRHFVSEHERGWLKAYDDLMQENGFMAVLLMRLLFFPHDLVSIGSGMSRVTIRQYMAGTFLGTLPHVATFVFLGDVFAEPRGWLFFGIMFAATLTVALLLRHSTWVKQRLFKKKEPMVFE